MFDVDDMACHKARRGEILRRGSFRFFNNAPTYVNIASCINPSAFGRKPNDTHTSKYWLARMNARRRCKTAHGATDGECTRVGKTRRHHLTYG